MGTPSRYIDTRGDFVLAALHRALPAIAAGLTGCALAPQHVNLTGGTAFRGPDAPRWTTQTSEGSLLQTAFGHKGQSETVRLQYSIPPGNGYAQILAPCTRAPTATLPFVFGLKAESTNHLEVKFEDKDGTVFGHRIELADIPENGTPIALYRDNIDYWWGGDDDRFGRPVRVAFAVSGTGQGTVWLHSIGFGPAGLPHSFAPTGPLLDPDRHLRGIGFRQRRAQYLRPTHPLVLAWLKREQDVSSPEQQLLRTMEGDLSHTFNNALVAMAFILTGERGRAERILDFYADATDPANTDPRRQSFFVNGEPRGFFQAVRLRAAASTPAYCEPGGSDRWIGDMAWLLIACKHYERQFSSPRYLRLATQMENLLVSFYTKVGGAPGGYVQHGWRRSDARLHEDHGHPEGNIDCYAAFRICGRPKLAQGIKLWLERELRGTKLPLDLFSWRVLAYGRSAADLLDIPEHDLRYRKTLIRDGARVSGFSDCPDRDVQNIWLDGTGHMACAYIVAGDRRRGYFYANQMDAFLLPRNIDGRDVMVLPYAANRSGNFSWVDPQCGFVSAGAWYIFAKHGFNPLTLEQVEVRITKHDQDARLETGTPAEQDKSGEAP